MEPGHSSPQVMLLYNNVARLRQFLGTIPLEKMPTGQARSGTAGKVANYFGSILNGARAQVIRAV
jgi:hypothetical protein